MRFPISGKNVNKMNRAYELLSAVMNDIESKGRDRLLPTVGNGTILDQLGCSLAALDAIYQDFSKF